MSYYSYAKFNQRKYLDPNDYDSSLRNKIVNTNLLTTSAISKNTDNKKYSVKLTLEITTSGYGMQHAFLCPSGTIVQSIIG
jgi:hypothetical protein